MGELCSHATVTVGTPGCVRNKGSNMIIKYKGFHLLVKVVTL